MWAIDMLLGHIAAIVSLFPVERMQTAADLLSWWIHATVNFGDSNGYEAAMEMSFADRLRKDQQASLIHSCKNSVYPAVAKEG